MKNSIICLIALILVSCAPLDKMSTNEKYYYGHKNLDSKIGVRAIQQCAEEGHGGCAQILGELYYKGKGIDKSFKDAEYWQKQAMATKYKYGWAGVFGAAILVEYYCEDSFFDKTKEEQVNHLNETQVLFRGLVNAFSLSGRERYEGMIKEFSEYLDNHKEKIANGECINT